MSNGGGGPRPEFGALVPLPGPSNERSPSALVRQPEGGPGSALISTRIRPVAFAPTAPFDARLVFTDRDARRASAFRTLRQRLLDAGEIHSILCTSANSGEGTTTLAANLALSFAGSVVTGSCSSKRTSAAPLSRPCLVSFRLPDLEVGSLAIGGIRTSHGPWSKSVRPRCSSWPGSRPPAPVAPRHCPSGRNFVVRVVPR